MSVDLGNGLKLANPVLTASGTFGYGTEYSDFVNLNELGGIIVKGTTLHHREGNAYPRMAETPSGMLNAVGLQNKGVDYFVEHIWPEIKDLQCAVIVNVSGASATDYVSVCEKLADLPELKAIEVNISCPNVKQGGMAFGTTCSGAEEITSMVRKAWPRHLMVKLSPNVTDITEISLAVESAGADSVSMVNTFLGMAVDVEHRRPVLSTVTGGLSGPCIRPIAVRMVWQAAQKLRIPVVGLGGITCGRDAAEFLLAGAKAVQIGTYNFVDPSVTVKTISWLEKYCKCQGIDRISDLKMI